MKQELDIYIRARYPLLWIVTPEEERAMQEISALADSQRKRVMAWSVTQGVVNPAVPHRVDASKRDPATVLTAIIEDPDRLPVRAVVAHHPAQAGEFPRCLRRLRDRQGCGVRRG